MGNWKDNLDHPKSRAGVLATIGIVVLVVGLLMFGGSLGIRGELTDEELVQASHVHPSQFDEALEKVQESRGKFRPKAASIGGGLVFLGLASIYFGMRPKRRGP